MEASVFFFTFTDYERLASIDWARINNYMQTFMWNYLNSRTRHDWCLRESHSQFTMGSSNIIGNIQFLALESNQTTAKYCSTGLGTYYTVEKGCATSPYGIWWVHTVCMDGPLLQTEAITSTLSLFYETPI